MTLTEIADDLYGMVLTDFTAARDERSIEVLTSGDRDLARQVKALRKPSATAWVVNQLIRHRFDEVQSLLDLGAQLREAQADLDRDTLQKLTLERRKVIATLAKRAGTLAEDLGHRVNAKAMTDLEQTLQAAMTDPKAAVAVGTGRLLRSLEVTGFEPVDLAGAVAVDGSPAMPVATSGLSRRADAAARELEEAKRKAQEAEQWARESEAALTSIDDRLEVLESDRSTLESKQQRLKLKLAELDDELSESTDESRALISERELAARTARSSRRSADRARDRMEYLS